MNRTKIAINPLMNCKSKETECSNLFAFFLADYMPYVIGSCFSQCQMRRSTVNLHG
jgi:hypothetical protein